MRQQDYKMVQGGNTRVNMSAGAASQAGNAMAKLGQTLAQTGQDVSKIMEATVDAQERTDLIRAKQKWKEIQAKQNIFQDKNKRDPLIWDENRQKLMKEFDAYNDGIKTYTKNGSLNLQLEREAWASDFEYGTLQGMQKRITMNLADEALANVKLSLANKNPEEASMALDQGRSHLTADTIANAEIQIKKGYDIQRMDDAKDLASADPQKYLEGIPDLKGYSRDEKDKLYSYTANKRNVQAREQLDKFEEAMLTGDGVSLEDFDSMQEQGLFSQVGDGEILKLRNGMERNLPLTNVELSEINGILAKLSEKRKEMTEEDYLQYYNSQSVEIRSMIGTHKGYGYITADLYRHNPYQKGGENLQSKNIASNNDELNALAEYHLKALNFSPQVYDEKRTTWAELSLMDKNRASQRQRDLLREGREFIDKNPDATSTEVRAWVSKKMNEQSAIQQYSPSNSAIRSGNTEPIKKKVNTHGGRRHMLKNKSLKQQQMDTSTGKVSNKANFGGSSGWTGGNTRKEVERNLVAVESPSGASFKVNKTVAGNFQSFLQELENEVGYQIKPSSSAGYNWRNKRGKKSLSQHSYGNAIDINWDENKAFWGGDDAISEIPNIDQIAAKHGLVWGGSWKNKDTMQFEYHPSTGVPARGI